MLYFFKTVIFSIFTPKLLIFIISRMALLNSRSAHFKIIDIRQFPAFLS